MEKYVSKKSIQKKLNIPITPENVYTTTSIGIKYDHSDARPKPHPQQQKNVKYLDELYSASFMDHYFS